MLDWNLIHSNSYIEVKIVPKKILHSSGIIMEMQKGARKKTGKQFLWDVEIVDPLGPAASEDITRECSEITENIYLLQPVVFELHGYARSCTEFFLRDQCRKALRCKHQKQNECFLLTILFGTLATSTFVVWRIVNAKVLD